MQKKIPFFPKEFFQKREGSGSVPLTNGSGSGRPKKCGSPTLLLGKI
jgi:hypothetical protein